MINKLVILVTYILNKRLKMKLIINFDGAGNFSYSCELGKEAIDKVLA